MQSTDQSVDKFNIIYSLLLVVTTKSNTAMRIIETARRLFMMYGYHKVSVDMIAKEANIAKGTLYHHFSSKEDLALEMVDLFLKDEIKMMETISENQNDPWRIIEGHIKSILGISARQDQGILLLLDLTTALTGSDNLTKLLVIVESFFANMNSIFENAGLGDEKTITILIALIDGLGFQALLRPGYFTEEKIAEITEHVIALIRGD